MKQIILSILLVLVVGPVVFIAAESTNISAVAVAEPMDVEVIADPKPVEDVAVVATNQSDNASNSVKEVAFVAPALVVITNSVVTNTVFIKNDQKVDELTQSLAAAKMRLLERSAIGNSGRLMDLERKSIEYDTMSVRIMEKDSKITELKTVLSKTDDALSARTAELAALKIAMQALSEKLQKLEAKDSEENFDTDMIFKVGKFEYYEVKLGDTFETIAGQPIIYNDISKAALLKQANRKILLKGGKLEPGSVIIVPRLPTSDQNEL